MRIKQAQSLAGKNLMGKEESARLLALVQWFHSNMHVIFHRKILGQLPGLG